MAGGWILPDAHTFIVIYNWILQELQITVSYSKFEARISANQLAMTPLST